MINDFETRYNLILKKIDRLRSQGVPEADLEMTKSRIELRDLLEFKKRNSKALQKIVPRLIGVKTIAVKTNLGDINLDFIQNKYVLFGTVLGIVALLYLFIKNYGK